MLPRKIFPLDGEATVRQCLVCGSDDHSAAQCSRKATQAANRLAPVKSKPTFTGGASSTQKQPPSLGGPAKAQWFSRTERRPRPSFRFANSEAQSRSNGYENLGRQPQTQHSEYKTKPYCKNCRTQGHYPADCPIDVPSSSRQPPPRTTHPDHSRPHRPWTAPYIPAARSPEELLAEGGNEAGFHFADLESLPVHLSGPEPLPAVPTTELFAELALDEALASSLKQMNFHEMLPVQRYAFATVGAGRDLMACSRTGSGKTLAFLLPIAQALLGRSSVTTSEEGRRTRSPRVLVLSPTRELASQTYKEAKKLTIGTDLSVRIIYGGVSFDYQERELRSSETTDFLIATPGRLLHMLREGIVSLALIEFVVLDEADRMIDDTFIHDVTSVLKDPDMPDPGDRLTLMFSATFPAEVHALAASFMKDHVFLGVGSVGGANESIRQELHLVPGAQKKARLLAWLKEETQGGQTVPPKTLVFLERRRSVDYLGCVLNDSGWDAVTIHGLRTQDQREAAFALFNAGGASVLVATSCCARGLDIKGVDVVINYDLPQTIEDFINRIGRTARVGNDGRSVSFFDPGLDGPLAGHLRKVMSDANQEIPDWLHPFVSANYS